VVRDRDTFYLLYSWKGSGNQRDRFFALLHRLNGVLATYKADDRLRLLATAEIISQDEVTFACPFAARLNALAARDGDTTQNFRWVSECQRMCML
jgi:hypothetical protein